MTENPIFDPVEWPVPFDRRVVYDEDEQPAIVVEVRGDKSTTAIEILRALRFLLEYWDTDESEA